MGRFLARRLVLTIPVLLGVATLVFSLIHMIPGDPAQAMPGEAAPQADVEELRRRLGLDRPLIEQYGLFLAGRGSDVRRACGLATTRHRCRRAARNGCRPRGDDAGAHRRVGAELLARSA